jgi:hypothetical protein
MPASPFPFGVTGLMRMSHKCLSAKQEGSLELERWIEERRGAVLTCRWWTFFWRLFAKHLSPRSPSCQSFHPNWCQRCCCCCCCRYCRRFYDGRISTCHSSLTKASYVISPSPFPHALTKVRTRPFRSILEKSNSAVRGHTSFTLTTFSSCSA